MKTVAIIGGTVHTVSRGTLRGATVLIRGGKIAAAGFRLPIPADAQRLDARGLIITPGFLDCHSHLGLAAEATGDAHMDKNEVSDPVSPHLRAIDGIDPEDEGLADAVGAGITSIIVTPGSEAVIGGQSAAIKTWGRVVDRMILRHPAGIKIAFGENPIQKNLPRQRPPSTRMTVAGMIREALAKARDYMEGNAGPGRNLRLEALQPVLRGEIPLRAHAHAAEDIMTAIRIAEEFNVGLTLEHATAGHKVADEIARRNIPAVIGPSITARVKVELRDRTYDTPRILYEAGVKIALTTDHPIVPISSLRLEAGLAVRAGLPWPAAMRAVTLNAAEIMGVSDRLGSIEPGKDADLVLYDGDPFAISSRPVAVIINGELVAGNRR